MMGLFEHWPYVNFHDLNLDWVIKEIPKVFASRDEAKAYAEASAESAAASQLSADASQASADASQLSAEASQQSASDSQESAEAAAASELSAKNYSDHIADPVSGIVTDWLEDNITPTTPAVDASLTIAGAAADAKAAGDKINSLNESVTLINEKGLMILNDYVQGNFNGTEIAASAYYISSGEHSFNFPIILTPETGYRYNVWTYENNAWTSTGLLSGSQYTVLENTLMRLVMARTESNTLTPLDGFDKVKLLSYIGFSTSQNNGNIEYLKDGKCLLPFKFQIGNDALGTFASYVKYRVTNKEFIRFDKDVTIFIKDGYKIGPHTFDDQGTYTADLGWKTKEFKASANTNYRFVIAKDPEDTTIIADIITFYEQLSMDTNIYEAANPLKLGFMMNGKSKLAAHTGYTAEGDPENTIPAYQSAGKIGYWGIESDLQETSDGYYVMCHDATVDRTTNGTGSISDMTLAQIRALHIKNHNDLQIPTFEEYLGICKMYGCVPVIEIKSTVTNTPENYMSIISIIENYGLKEQCILIGSKWIIAQLREANKTIPYLPVYQSGFSYDFIAELNACAAYENMGMDWDYLSTVSLERAEMLHSRKMLFGTFTVDDLTQVQDAFANGVDFVTTNTIKPTD